jgi:hypothetical protein
MGLASYEIVGSAGEWRVRHDGRADNIYQTKESAFEAAVAAGRRDFYVVALRPQLVPRTLVKSAAWYPTGAARSVSTGSGV